MSSGIPIVIDPESLTELEILANAAYLDATDVPEDIQSRLPSETTPVTTLLKTCIPACLPTTCILCSIGLCTGRHLSARIKSVDRRVAQNAGVASCLDAHLKGKPQLVVDYRGAFHHSPSSSGPNSHFPLWIMNLWYTAMEVAEQRDSWKAAKECGYRRGRRIPRSVKQEIRSRRFLRD